MKKYLFILLAFIAPLAWNSCGGNLFSQNKVLDSLKSTLLTTKVDTSKISILNKLAWEMKESATDMASKYCTRSLALIKSLTNVNNNKYVSDWLEFATSEVYNNLGVLNNLVTQDNKLALDYHFKAREIRERLIKSPNKLISFKCKKGLGETYKNIGNVYAIIDKDKAIEFFLKALPYLNQTNDKIGMALINANLGSIYVARGEYDEALNYLKEALNIANQVNDKSTLAVVLVSYGNYYSAMGSNSKAKVETDANYFTALGYFFQALKVSESDDDKTMALRSIFPIVEIYKSQKKYDDAISYLMKSLSIAKQLKSKVNEANSYNALAEVYVLKSDFKKAFTFSQQYNRINDSVMSKQLSYEITDVQKRFEKEKKEKELEMINKMKEAENKAESNKQRLVRNIFIFGFIGLLIFLFVIVNRLLLIRKQKNIIEHQKQLVEYKNQSITSSINYALRIQKAILPPPRIVQQSFINSFIVYKPKDIVAGDFYWMETILLDKFRLKQLNNSGKSHSSPIGALGQSIVFFAACDCTGHGVPGAMVSVVCHGALNRAVLEFGLIEPAAILNKTEELVIENFSKSENVIQDGMDVSLCAYNPETKKLQWAGANNPLWIVRANSHFNNPELAKGAEGLGDTPHHFEIIEINADKKSIGSNDNPHPFTNHEFSLQANDSIYIFSDGYTDQFGGEKDKKLTKNRFRKLILSIQDKSMSEQGVALDNFIADYRKETEQTDDILVMGIKV